MPLDYEPEQGKSIKAQAQARGMDALAYMYDLLAEGDGKTVLIGLAANFASNDHSGIERICATLMQYQD